MENVPQRILGFINTHTIRYPFAFIGKVLYFLPPSEHEWNERKRKLTEQIEAIGINDINDEWQKNDFYIGETSLEKGIIFKTWGVTHSDNGFEHVEIESFYEYSSSVKSDGSIDGLSIESDELEYFYNITNRPSEGLSSYHNQATPNERSAATASDSKIDLGSFNLGETVIRYEMQIYSRFSVEPVIGGNRTKKTTIKLYFDKPISFQESLKIIQSFKQFLKFICYRSNIEIDSIITLSRNHENWHTPSGKIFLTQQSKKEVDNKKKVRIISYDLLKTNTIKLIEATANNEIYLNHICKNITKQSTYTMGRAIMIFAAFEKEYARFFSETATRSPQFLEIKQKAIEALSNLQNEVNSKGKRYLNNYIKGINKSENSLETRIKTALLKYLHLIKIILYSLYGLDNEKLISDIAERMRVLRNDFAHGNLDIELRPAHLSDLKILEMLLYVMRLDSIKLEDYEIKRSIKQLFGLTQV